MPAVDYAALAKEAGAVSSAPPPSVGAHPEARMSAAAPPAMIGDQPVGPAMPGNADDVTLGDLVSHPAETIAKIGASIKRDVTDPKTWMAVAAAYFGPKVFPTAGASIARAASRASAAASRGAAAIEPADIVGMIPRSVVKGAQIMQKVGAAMREPEPPETAAAAPSSVASPEIAPAAAPAKPAMAITNAADLAEFTKQIRAGKTTKQAMEIVAASRALNNTLGLPTPSAADLQFPKGMRGGAPQ